MNKESKRVKLTKRIIKSSLVDMLKTYPISKVSVKKLCEIAEINRSTFYAYYTDPYDLLYQIQGEVINDLSDYISRNAFSEHTALTVQAMTKILEYAKENSELFKVLLSENGDITFQKDIMRLAQKKTINELRSTQSIEPRTSEYLQLFIITGALSVMNKWLQDEMPESPGQMAGLCSSLLYKGLSAYPL